MVKYIRAERTIEQMKASLHKNGGLDFDVLDSLSDKEIERLESIEDWNEYQRECEKIHKNYYRF